MREQEGRAGSINRYHRRRKQSRTVSVKFGVAEGFTHFVQYPLVEHLLKGIMNKALRR